MKILALVANRQAVGAVEVYRVTMPLTYLENLSEMRTDWMPKGAAAMQIKYGRSEFLNVDIVVLAKFMADEDLEALVDVVRYHGAKAVYETDDDYSGRYRPADPTRGGDWRKILPYVDAITVTCSHLAELAREDSGGKPVYVVPNAIELSWFRAVSSAAVDLFSDQLTVMLAGTKTHQGDWRVVAEVMPQILADYPDVKFLAVCEKEYYGYLGDAGAMFMPPAPYIQYPALLRQADILCAPLIPEDRFNWSKSPIKVIEGWSAERPISRTRVGGAALVASKAPPYTGVVQNRHNGLIVDHTPEAWDVALRLLIEDRVLRQKVQYEGLKDARRFDIKTRWVDWHRAYKQIGG
jgi:glycosyltransferase involved in cell wall biosynthesis